MPSMKRKFSYCNDFDPYKCLDLGCYDVEENLIYEENGEIIDEEMFCNGDFSNIEICPLKAY